MSTLKVNAFQDTSGKGFYPARAWAHWDSVSTLVIDNSENISSITDNGTGNHTLNFSNSMANATYAISGTSGGEMNSYSSRAMFGNTFATGSLNVRMQYQPNGTSGFYDCNHNCAVIHGG